MHSNKSSTNDTFLSGWLYSGDIQERRQSNTIGRQSKYVPLYHFSRLHVFWNLSKNFTATFNFNYTTNSESQLCNCVINWRFSDGATVFHTKSQKMYLHSTHHIIIESVTVTHYTIYVYILRNLNDCTFKSRYSLSKALVSLFIKVKQSVMRYMCLYFIYRNLIKWKTFCTFND